MYPQSRAVCLLAFVGALALLTGTTGCKKKSPLDPSERGKLPRIAAALEKAYGDNSLPNVTEPPGLAERLAKWDDFRSCTVRTYVARKRHADALAKDGLKEPSRHASIGEAAVEECAVQSALANKDPSMCERLAGDFTAPTGGMPLSAVRCWDTRARVLGLPDECPVLWLPDDLPGRNAECLAMARRDPSFCHFADDPPRCRALLAGDPAACAGAAPDCAAAVAYWADLIPLALEPPLIDLKTNPNEQPVGITVDLRVIGSDKPTVRIQGPRSATGVSWPAGKASVAWTEGTTQFWGAEVASEAVQVTWRAGQPAVKLAFSPAGTTSGTRPVVAPGRAAGATILLVWADPREFRRCAPGPDTKGELKFDAGAARPGGFVTGSLSAAKVPCSDGTSVDVSVKFKLVILDVR